MVEVVSQLLDVGEKTVFLKAEAYCEGVVILTKGDNDGQRKNKMQTLPSGGQNQVGHGSVWSVYSWAGIKQILCVWDPFVSVVKA